MTVERKKKRQGKKEKNKRSGKEKSSQRKSKKRKEKGKRQREKGKAGKEKYNITISQPVFSGCNFLDRQNGNKTDFYSNL